VIFAKADHIKQILGGTKTQTRRSSDRYNVGKTYSIQPCRTCKGIPEGRILIEYKIIEQKGISGKIHKDDAKAEGGYTSEGFEELYEKMYPSWEVRYAYVFRFVPSEEGEE